MIILKVDVSMMNEAKRVVSPASSAQGRWTYSCTIDAPCVELSATRIAINDASTQSRWTWKRKNC